MKILYGINTIGSGHINRSSVVISQLQKDGHHVDCIFSGPNPPKYALKIANRYTQVHGYRMKFNGQNPDPIMTFWENFKKARSILKSLFKSFRISLSQDYDAIISDFELSTCLAGFFLRKPVIIVDHQHSLIHPGALRAPGKFSDIFNALIAMGMSNPYFKHIFALDLVNQPIRRFKETLFPLIWKPEMIDLSVSVEDHYCVYLPYIPINKICKVFSEFPETTFHVYGFDMDKTHRNIHFKPTSRYGFLEDMASSKGVISHTGFSITWEIMLLKKPFYTIPLEHHYEQQTNAYRLSKKNLAFVGDDLSIYYLKRFIDQCEQDSFLNKGDIRILEPNTLTKCIYKEIAKA
ncbi:MAG: hypothetical protein BAJALOKI3v1_980002 [Promethearchaeota archaeon]|nr:MAG: hypothetical protein BAJALOKI3v1_980002 [Candidatus Lokiarchaeota archaeon]